METETGQIIFIIVASACMIALMTFVVFSLFLRLRNRQLNHRNQVLAINEQFAQELVKSKHDVTEQVFKNIATELHDNINQTLTAAMTQLNKIKQEKEFDPVRLSQTKDTVNQAIEDIQNISQSMNSDYIKHFDIHTALKKITNRLVKTTGIEINLNIQPDAIFASKDHEIILIRILQELISNSIKHSGALLIELTIEKFAGGIRIIYTDNGRGFEDGGKIKGMGLMTIKQRLDLMKARWEISSSPGQGFFFQATMENFN